MVTVTNLPRKFSFQQNGKSQDLPDPNPAFSPEAVLNFYSNTYPELTTAKISGPSLTDSGHEYRFDSVIGKKG